MRAGRQFAVGSNFIVAQAGDDDDRHFGELRMHAELTQHCDAVNTGHAQIGHQYLGLDHRDIQQGLDSRDLHHRVYGQVPTVKVRLVHVAGVGVVFDHHDFEVFAGLRR